ncbi:ISAs1 family transposase [Photobacterium sagamiensis]
MYLTSDLFDEFVDLSFEWPGMKSIGVAVSHRVEGDDESGEVSVRYFISSAELDAEKFAHSVRGHWAIENSLHWVLDVTMREDESRIVYGNAGENLARFRHMALNRLKAHPFKGSIKRKQMKAILNKQFLEEVLFG